MCAGKPPGKWHVSAEAAACARRRTRRSAPLRRCHHWQTRAWGQGSATCVAGQRAASALRPRDLCGGGSHCAPVGPRAAAGSPVIAARVRGAFRRCQTRSVGVRDRRCGVGLRRVRHASSPPVRGPARSAAAKQRVDELPRQRAVVADRRAARRQVTRRGSRCSKHQVGAVGLRGRHVAGARAAGGAGQGHVPRDGPRSAKRGRWPRAGAGLLYIAAAAESHLSHRRTKAPGAAARATSNAALNGTYVSIKSLRTTCGRRRRA